MTTQQRINSQINMALDSLAKARAANSKPWINGCRARLIGLGYQGPEVQPTVVKKAVVTPPSIQKDGNTLLF